MNFYNIYQDLFRRVAASTLLMLFSRVVLLLSSYLHAIYLSNYAHLSISYNTYIGGLSIFHLRPSENFYAKILLMHISSNYAFLNSLVYFIISICIYRVVPSIYLSINILSYLSIYLSILFPSIHPICIFFHL